MLLDVNPNEILFLDIETVSQHKTFDELSPEWQLLWEKKAKLITKYQAEPSTAQDVYERAAIYAEFGKIVCISVGYTLQSEGRLKMRLKSFYGQDEKVLLEEFALLLNRHFGGVYKFMCAHNGIEFDFPYLCRRLLINGIELPIGLQLAGKKQWENRHLIDTMDLWKFGDYKAYTSLEVLAAAFGIETPKDDISGADIYRVYYEDSDLQRIVTYCQKDVSALCNLYRTMNQLPFIGNEDLEIA